MDKVTLKLSQNTVVDALIAWMQQKNIHITAADLSVAYSGHHGDDMEFDGYNLIVDASRVEIRSE